MRLNVFRSLSFKKKIFFYGFIVSSLSLVIACASFILYDHITIKKTLVNRISTEAEILAKSAGSSLAFYDADFATKLLEGLDAEPHFVAASIFETNGTIFVSYVKDRSDYQFPSLSNETTYQFKSGYLDVFKPVFFQNETIGTIFIRSDLTGLSERFKQYITIAFSVMVISILAAILISVKLQRILTRSVDELERTAKIVADQKDYSVRAVKYSEDELGVLTDAFNEMMATIQTRDANLRESEDRFKKAVENIPDVVVIYDTDLRIQYINSAAIQVTGRLVSDFIGKREEEIWPPEVYQSYLPILQGAHRSGEIRFAEVEITFPDVGYRNLKITCVPLADEKGNVIEIVGVTHDFTEQKQREDAIRKLNEELEQRVHDRTAQLEASNKELESFTYSVSHDLRAPLRSMDGFSLALLEDYEDKIDDQGKDFLQRIRTSSTDMAKLIDGLLDLSRLTREKMIIEDIDFTHISEKIIEGLLNQEPERKVECLIQPGLTAKGDSRLLKSVLENLLGNAWKFSAKRKTAQIEFGEMLTRKSEEKINGETRVRKIQDSERVYFVRDNGAGFDMTYADKLFGVFQRLHRTDEFPGTGVGLATVERIIIRHGGRIWAESKEGEGAVFYFTLGT